jgi:hypothetical protein
VGCPHSSLVTEPDPQIDGKNGNGAKIDCHVQIRDFLHRGFVD